MIDYSSDESNNYQYIACEIDEELFGMSRTELINILLEENILARKYFFPGVHNMEPYKSLYPYSSIFLPKTEYIANRIISFPTGTAVDSATISKIIALVNFIHKNAKSIKNRLEGTGC